MNGLIILSASSNSATFTGCWPMYRRAESPRPIPITIRPFEMSCRVAYALARTVGSRVPGFVTMWPSLIFDVRSAAMASVGIDSCQRTCESYVQAYSNPWLSASCMSSIIRWYGGSGRTVTPNESDMRMSLLRQRLARNGPHALIGCDGCVRCKDAGSANSGAIREPEDAAACVPGAAERPVRSFRADLLKSRGEDHLHRPQLRGARGRAGRRAAHRSAHLLEVREHADR